MLFVAVIVIPIVITRVLMSGLYSLFCLVFESSVDFWERIAGFALANIIFKWNEKNFPLLKAQ